MILTLSENCLDVSIMNIYQNDSLYFVLETFFILTFNAYIIHLDFYYRSIALRCRSINVIKSVKIT